MNIVPGGDGSHRTEHPRASPETGDGVGVTRLRPLSALRKPIDRNRQTATDYEDFSPRCRRAFAGSAAGLAPKPLASALLSPESGRIAIRSIVFIINRLSRHSPYVAGISADYEPVTRHVQAPRTFIIGSRLPVASMTTYELGSPRSAVPPANARSPRRRQPGGPCGACALRARHGPRFARRHGPLRWPLASRVGRAWLVGSRRARAPATRAKALAPSSAVGS